MTAVPSYDELVALDAAHVMQTYGRAPVAFVRGEGTVLYDANGRRYLDFLSGLAVTSLGHAHPVVADAVAEQARTLLHVSNLYYNAVQPQVAARLNGLLGGDGRVFFCNSGAEANEAAFKISRLTGRPEVITAEGSFHGRTMGALALTGQPGKADAFAPLPGGVRYVPYGDGDALAEVVSDATAMVLLEPMLGEGGVLPAPSGYLASAASAAARAGALFALDEVQTGMGRTGTLWSYEALGVRPDAITVAKALGGGLPIGALLTAPELRDVLAPGDHGSTFPGGPVVCAAALAALEIVDDEALLASVRALGERLRAGLEELPGVRSVRGRGLMCACDVAADAPDVARRTLLDERLVVNATGPETLRFLPPLTAGEAEIADGLARLGRILR